METGIIGFRAVGLRFIWLRDNRESNGKHMETGMETKGLSFGLYFRIC